MRGARYSDHCRGWNERRALKIPVNAKMAAEMGDYDFEPTFTDFDVAIDLLQMVDEEWPYNSSRLQRAKQLWEMSSDKNSRDSLERELASRMRIVPKQREYRETMMGAYAMFKIPQNATVKDFRAKTLVDDFSENSCSRSYSLCEHCHLTTGCKCDDDSGSVSADDESFELSEEGSDCENDDHESIGTNEVADEWESVLAPKANPKKRPSPSKASPPKQIKRRKMGGNVSSSAPGCTFCFSECRDIDDYYQRRCLHPFATVHNKHLSQFVSRIRQRCVETYNQFATLIERRRTMLTRLAEELKGQEKLQKQMERQTKLAKAKSKPTVRCTVQFPKTVLTPIFNVLTFAYTTLAKYAPPTKEELQMVRTRYSLL